MSTMVILSSVLDKEIYISNQADRCCFGAFSIAKKEYLKEDFITFGMRIGVLPKKLSAIIDMFAAEQPKVYELIENSFLEEKVKRMYKQSYQERLHRFQRSDK